MPQRIQRQRTKGWRLPPDAVIVTRPTIWGNPFVHDTDPAQAVEAYRRLISGGMQSFEMGPDKLRWAEKIHRHTLHWAYADWVHANIHTLRGKNLACYCALGQPCHGDVLLDLANKPIDPAIIDELRQWWNSACDCDGHPDGFFERMEAAGLAELVKVTRQALGEISFAEERGIELGGNMWQLTVAGHAVMAES